MWHVHAVSAANQHRSGYIEDGSALSDCQSHGAAHRRIGCAGDGWRGVVGGRWCIDGDRRGSGIDCAAIGSRASVASWVSDLGSDGIRALSQCLRQIDGIGATSQNRRGHGNDGSALGNGQGDGAAHWRIGCASDGRRGVVGDGRSIDGNHRSSGIDGSAVGSAASVAGSIGDGGIDRVRALNQTSRYVR